MIYLVNTSREKCKVVFLFSVYFVENDGIFMGNFGKNAEEPTGVCRPLLQKGRVCGII